MVKKAQSIFTLENKAQELGFMKLEFQQTGLEEATVGNTVLVFSNNKAAANIVQRHYYQKISETQTRIREAAELAFYFSGGGKILILTATKKHNLDGYDPATTYYRLDWRK